MRRIKKSHFWASTALAVFVQCCLLSLIQLDFGPSQLSGGDVLFVELEEEWDPFRSDDAVTDETKRRLVTKHIKKSILYLNLIVLCSYTIFLIKVIFLYDMIDYLSFHYGIFLYLSFPQRILNLPRSHILLSY